MSLANSLVPRNRMENGKSKKSKSLYLDIAAAIWAGLLLIHNHCVTAMDFCTYTRFSKIF